MANERNKNVLLAALLVGLVTLSVAYALLSQRLNINSSAVVKQSNWNVHFENVSCTASNYAEVTTPMSISGSTTLSGLVATFKAPGDSVSCTFNVKNSGSINAILNSYAKQDATKTITYTGSGANKAADEALLNGKILYNLVYVDGGAEPATGNVLNAGASKQLRLTLTFDSNVTELPTNDVTIANFSTYMIYNQN